MCFSPALDSAFALTELFRIRRFRLQKSDPIFIEFFITIAGRAGKNAVAYMISSASARRNEVVAMS